MHAPSACVHAMATVCMLAHLSLAAICDLRSAIGGPRSAISDPRSAICYACTNTHYYAHSSCIHTMATSCIHTYTHPYREPTCTPIMHAYLPWLRKVHATIARMPVHTLARFRGWSWHLPEVPYATCLSYSVQGCIVAQDELSLPL